MSTQTEDSFAVYGMLLGDEVCPRWRLHMHIKIPRRKEGRINTCQTDLIRKWYYVLAAKMAECIESVVVSSRTQRYFNSEEEYYQEKIQEMNLMQVQEELTSESPDVTNEALSTFLQRLRRYDYYMLYHEGGNLPAFYRRHVVTQSVVQLLDLNTIGQLVPDSGIDADFVNVNEIKVSTDDRYLAFTLSTEPGEEWYTLFVKDLVSGLIVNKGMQQVYSFEWGEELDLFYTVSDHLARPYKVMYHRLESGEPDLLLFEESNPTFLVDVAKTRDNKYILISSNSKTTSEVRVLPVKEQDKRKFVLIHERIPNLQYFPEHTCGKFILVTNHTYDREFGLLEVPADEVLQSRETGDSPKWSKILYTDEKKGGGMTEVVGVTELDVFEKHAVVYRRNAGKQSVDVIDLTNDGAYTGRTIDFSTIFPADVPFTIQPGINSTFKSTSVRLNLSCMIEPEISCVFDMEEFVFREIPDRAPTNPNLVCKTEMVDNNGVRVPITYAYMKTDTMSQGPRPLLLTVYGAYGINNDANYNFGHMSLIKRGWIVAHAHVRGGGEKGRKWYESGRALQKRNSFDDFVAVANHFIDTGLSEPSMMAASAFSAGALTLGVTANEHPGLFKAMVLRSPFLDVLETMLDSALPLTNFEFEEWGNPQEDEECYEYIKSYDPCINVEKMFSNGNTHPALMVQSSLYDQRVRFWGPAKYVARIRELSPNSENVIFSLTGETHFGAGGRFGQVNEQAFENAFLLHHIDLAKAT